MIATKAATGICRAAASVVIPAIIAVPIAFITPHNFVNNGPILPNNNLITPHTLDKAGPILPKAIFITPHTLLNAGPILPNNTLISPHTLDKAGPILPKATFITPHALPNAGPIPLNKLPIALAIPLPVINLNKWWTHLITSWIAPTTLLPPLTTLLPPHININAVAISPNIFAAVLFSFR